MIHDLSVKLKLCRSFGQNKATRSVSANLEAQLLRCHLFSKRAQTFHAHLPEESQRMRTDSQGATLVTSHLHHHPCARHGAERRSSGLCRSVQLSPPALADRAAARRRVSDRPTPLSSPAALRSRLSAGQQTRTDGPLLERLRRDGTGQRSE